MAEGTHGAGVAPDLVTLTIDGKEVKVPKGTNVIEAAKVAGIDIPHYCYHQDLSIAGNCRMCQVRIEGLPKMEIGCNTIVREGMKVSTHESNKDVADAQAATLEFILINHPLDCTVCDQAGHCKLQDYHYEYNARPSRFTEHKEKKVKAVPLGPTVMLDGERCIMCTRCIRFCDEITQTSELGMLNRGDRSVISISPGRELDNPLSGSVVDLCPVGALTHRNWRFNTRIWFTQSKDSICPGCSTGCNVKVHERDKEIVLIKARRNAAVNKEWLCDEGRYGFHRFLPATRLTSGRVAGREVPVADAARDTRGLTQSGESVVLIAPDLLTEEYALIKKFVSRSMPQALVAIAYQERKLSKTEALLVSPDYAANFRGAEFAGLVAGDLNAGYIQALDKIRRGGLKSVLIIGDGAIRPDDCDAAVLSGIKGAAVSVALLSDAGSPLVTVCNVVLPSRSILEKSGLLINRAQRVQYSDSVIAFPEGCEPSWRLMNMVAEACGGRLTAATNDREFTQAYLAEEKRLSGLTIAAIKRGGVDLRSRSGAVPASSAVQPAA